MPSPEEAALRILGVIDDKGEYRGKDAYYYKADLMVRIPEGWEVCRKFNPKSGTSYPSLSFDSDGNVCIKIRKKSRDKRAKRGRPRKEEQV